MSRMILEIEEVIKNKIKSNIKIKIKQIDSLPIPDFLKPLLLNEILIKAYKESPIGNREEFEKFFEEILVEYVREKGGE